MIAATVRSDEPRAIDSGSRSNSCCARHSLRVLHANSQTRTFQSSSSFAGEHVIDDCYYARIKADSLPVGTVRFLLSGVFS